ncbi:hypothetical protein FNAPI_7219 [Fusarium napiforme]|uniref:Ankyrin repeat protein n=1 Tax=Fusarium napiforme TaxID=42672 RepID=A0A8H5JF40_9HYPO|nr:hypothetical protein FNAPI_7219 [Fusarium napiforme]
MASQESGQNNNIQDESFKEQLDKAADSTRELENRKPNPVVEKITEYVPAAAKILPARQSPPKEEDKPPGPPERPHHDDKIEDFDGMSPLLGITPPTDIVAKQRPDGEFPISKGYNLLSVSRNGKGNATPWEVTQRSGEGRGGSENIKKMLFDLRSKNKRDREKLLRTLIQGNGGLDFWCSEEVTFMFNLPTGCSDVELLLQMGARVDDYQRGNNTTAIQAAVISGSIGTVQTVLHTGADINDSRGVALPFTTPPTDKILKCVLFSYAEALW